MRYKGQYIGVVTIDFDIDGNKEGVLPFDEVKEGFSHFTEMLTELVEYELDEQGTVHVCELRSELHEEEDDG